MKSMKCCRWLFPADSSGLVWSHAFVLKHSLGRGDDHRVLLRVEDLCQVSSY